MRSIYTGHHEPHRMTISIMQSLRHPPWCFIADIQHSVSSDYLSNLKMLLQRACKRKRRCRPPGSVIDFRTFCTGQTSSCGSFCGVLRDEIGKQYVAVSQYQKQRSSTGRHRASQLASPLSKRVQPADIYALRSVNARSPKAQPAEINNFKYSIPGTPQVISNRWSRIAELRPKTVGNRV